MGYMSHADVKFTREIQILDKIYRSCLLISACSSILCAQIQTLVSRTDVKYILEFVNSYSFVVLHLAIS